MVRSGRGCYLVGVMGRIHSGNAMIVSFLIAALVMLSSAMPMAAQEGGIDHDVVGRFSMVSEAGGGVWAFQASGKLIVTGPGDQIAEGTWSAADGSSSKFDAMLDVTVTGQQLKVLGDVSPDRQQAALLVIATPPNDEQNAVPWPAQSRLTGQRFGFVAEPTAEPSADPMFRITFHYGDC